MKALCLVWVLLSLAGSLASAATVERRAARIMIHAVDVEEVSPKEVFQLLQDQAKKADPDGRGINMLFRFSPAGQKIFSDSKLTLKMNNVPLTELVRYVCLVSGLRYSYDQNALMVFDSVAPQSMDTRVYNLNAGILDSTRTRHKPKHLEGVGDEEDEDD